MCVTDPDFLEKLPIEQKLTQIFNTGLKTGFWGFFKKVTSLVLSGICLKRKFLWVINILQNLHALQKSGSQVIAKNGSRPMRFQCSLIVNISLID